MPSSLAFLPSLPLVNCSHNCFPSASPRRQALQCNISTDIPDAGLIDKSGITGTTCANLWPIPILGPYCWFLNVYDRDVAAKTGAFVVKAGQNNETLTLSFSSNEKMMESTAGDTHRSFRGIVTGNINVAKFLKELGSPSHPYILKFFEAGGSEMVGQRLNELHLQDPSWDVHNQSTGNNFWQHTAPMYSVLTRNTSFEVHELYSIEGATPKTPSRFEYFAMNLCPIFPFSKYSCFVCVWKQIEGGCPVAIDKYGGTIQLSFCDPRTISQPSVSADSRFIGKVAVKDFYGTITDAIAASEHKSLLSAIEATPSLAAISNKDFRVLVHNEPKTFAGNRRNSIWVPVQ